MMQKKFYPAVLALLCVSLPACAGAMKKYNAKYHVIYSDLPKEDVYEAISRVNAMAEQYHNRTKSFGGKITKKLPFYLYSKYSDYQASIGSKLAGSAGVYTGKELRAAADTSMFPKDLIWHTVQHEGFHQFVHMVITSGKQDVMPIWLNEGMAEYFGEAKWTGDKLVPGVVDTGEKFRKGKKIYTRQGRMQRVQEALKNDKFKPFARMITLSHGAWNSEMDVTNYDQAWSMVHFFVHAQDSKGGYKYRKQFQKYIDSVVKGNDNAKSFGKYVGNPSRVEKEYKDWWLSWKTNPSQDICDRILIETLVNFMARAEVENKTTFNTPEEFFKAAEDGKIELSTTRYRSLWLPQGLLKSAVTQARRMQDCEWEIRQERRNSTLVLKHKDGSEVQCTYKTRGSSQPILKTAFVSSDEGKTKRDADDD